MAVNCQKGQKMKLHPDKNFLPFTNDFIFGMVMRNPDICADFLNTILPKEKFREVKMKMPDNPLFSEELEMPEDFDIEKMTIEIQKSLRFEKGKHGVRFDAYAETPEQSAEIEMQTYEEKHIGKRSRFYRSNIDMDQLEAGDSYEKLKRTFIIMITTYDPFNLDCAVYFFQSFDIENDLILNDYTYTMVLNTACSYDRIPEHLQALYEYINDPSKCEGSTLVKAIDARVQKFNTPEWRRRQMTFEHMLKRESRKGQELFAKLTLLLLEENRTDDLKRAASDEKYRDELFAEFDLESPETI
ncbi:MAG: Rpn family recombination-promoting nuclease/putative transposase [Firmicutes bacterium]|nr:Rpn family recombination-promoting nuclease/putative transposase [Bacillota bacterium]